MGHRETSRHPVPPRLRFVAVLVALGALGCAPPDGTVEAERLAAQAERLWHERAPGAYDALLAVPAASPAGIEARERLAAAARHYQEGLAAVAANDLGRAADAFAAGARLAPPEPALYVPLADWYAARGLDEPAARYYRKFLAARPASPASARVRLALAALTVDVGAVLEAPPRPTPAGPRGASPLAWLALGALAVLLAGTVLVALWRWLPRAELERLVARHPEQHLAIAYLVGTLRHELIKHRVSVVTETLATLATGRATATQRDFLRRRLAGVPLDAALTTHVATFERALDHGLRLGRDPAFRRAARALRILDELRRREGAWRTGDARRLRATVDEIRRFDERLAALLRRLVRTRLDATLLTTVADEVRAEAALSSSPLDELSVVTGPRPVLVDVPREDVVLIVKNVLRNALLATSREPPPHRIRLAIATRLLPSGEEAVWLAVADTSREAIDLVAAERRGPHAGLGLVIAAVRRYGGMIEVRPGGEGFAKEVAVRFFRVLADAPEEDGGA